MKIKSSYDPYDFWSLTITGSLKSKLYQKKIYIKFLVAFLYLTDWLMPLLIRRLFCQKHTFPHVVAMEFLSSDVNNLDKKKKQALIEYFKNSRCGLSESKAWGLPFKWFSKNASYSGNTPYITNTPYVIELLFKLKESDETLKDVDLLLNDAWNFLESLEVKIDTNQHLAVAYAPVKEERIVINANSYAAYMYALYAKFENKHKFNQANIKAKRITNWLIDRQNIDGYWYYYDDEKEGNFVDCFHSCFVIKNLLKIQELNVISNNDGISATCTKGWNFIQREMYDEKKGLCKRFYKRELSDLFKWDIYDQAEYLGLLMLFSTRPEVDIFVANVHRHFKRNDDFFCRIDIFGRRWGKNFNRWGIVPFKMYCSKYSEDN